LQAEQFALPLNYPQHVTRLEGHTVSHKIFDDRLVPGVRVSCSHAVSVNLDQSSRTVTGSLTRQMTT